MSDFSDFDDYFSPSEPKKFLNINDLPVGDYEFQIQKAEATQLMKTGEKIVDFSLLVAKGPMPGKPPMSVPKRQPIKAYMRFCSVNATPKPRARLSNNSMA